MSPGESLRILAVSGASGGHIFPAVSFLDYFRERYKYENGTLLVLPRQISSQKIEPRGQNLSYISVSNFSRGLKLQNFYNLFNFLKGTAESFFILSKFKPDIVVGFGSLVSIPVVFWAWIFRIKILIHEQNVVPGRANRLLAKFSDKIAVSFRETSNYLRARPDKIALTGNPIRARLKRYDRRQAKEFFGLALDKFTVLVAGGSRGSHRINIFFLEAMGQISGRCNIQVIHLAGEQDYGHLNNGYKELGINHKIFTFLHEMEYAYSAADLVVARAGATTLAEIVFFGIPAIIIPYPFAYQHQLANARVLAEKGCAKVFNENKLNIGELSRALEELINNPAQIEAMKARYDDFPKLDAAERLSIEAMSLLS